MVLLTAVSAEVNRVQALTVVAGKELLPIHGERAVPCRFERAVGGARARHELMQLECEEAAGACVATSGSVSLGKRRGHEELAQHLLALLQWQATVVSEALCRRAERLRSRPDPLAPLPLDAEAGFDPDGERVLFELGIGDRRRDARGQSGRQLRLDRLCRPIAVRCPYEGLPDDITRQHGGAEQCAGHPRDSFTPGVFVATGHRGRCADAAQSRRRQQRTDAPHQQRHVGTLPPAVGVKLVEHQELQALAVANHVLIDRVLAGHQVLKHHEVRQQDVRRVRADRAAGFGVFLPREARERQRLLRRDELQELVEFLHLAVGQRIHRVNDDRPRAPLRIDRLCTQDGVHDRDEEAQ